MAVALTALSGRSICEGRAQVRKQTNTQSSYSFRLRNLTIDPNIDDRYLEDGRSTSIVLMPLLYGRARRDRRESQRFSAFSAASAVKGQAEFASTQSRETTGG